MAEISAMTKDCPQCRALLAADAPSCVCGHHFPPEAADNHCSSDLVTQAEQLFETHLRARHQRALRVVKLAKVDLLRDPGDSAKRAQLREAEKEAKALEVQLAIQTARVSDARATADRARSESADAAAAAAIAPDAFHSIQSAKAEQAYELARIARAANERSANPASTVFQAFQAERARAAASADAFQSCPGCGAIVPNGIARCECGYRLLASNDTASDFLSAEELAALRGNS